MLDSQVENGFLTEETQQTALTEYIAEQLIGNIFLWVTHSINLKQLIRKLKYAWASQLVIYVSEAKKASLRKTVIQLGKEVEALSLPVTS